MEITELEFGNWRATHKFWKNQVRGTLRVLSLAPSLLLKHVTLYACQLFPKYCHVTYAHTCTVHLCTNESVSLYISIFPLCASIQICTYIIFDHKRHSHRYITLTYLGLCGHTLQLLSTKQLSSSSLSYQTPLNLRLSLTQSPLLCSSFTQPSLP